MWSRKIKTCPKRRRGLDNNPHHVEIYPVQFRLLCKGGQAIGVGAGQQSRVHCTRLAGSKADNWYLRQHPKVLSLPWRQDVKRADRDNAIDIYISQESESLLQDGVWQTLFTRQPDVLTETEKRAWLDGLKGVSLGSDAFFPFGDNIERAAKSGVEFIPSPAAP